jgi:8-oxo-dGTP pyrophosphatase MutT (NUDIX family)
MFESPPRGRVARGMKRETSETLNDASRDGLLRTISFCNNVVLPGGRVPFLIGRSQVGWVMPDFARALQAYPGVSGGPGVSEARAGVTLASEHAGDLQTIARALADVGRFRWRGEAFDVRAAAGGPMLGQLDRGALPAFGILAVGVHLNGLVRRPEGLHMWVARRAADKLLDPGKLDHIAAGGVPAGLTPVQTLLKEAEEEAALPPALTRAAVEVARIGYVMERPEGLRRDLLVCYDLELPQSFIPRAADGEVESFELWPLEQALATARSTERFKFNVNLVLIDLFLRNGLVRGDDGQRLRAALDSASLKAR